MALYKHLPVLLQQRKEIQQYKGITNKAGLYQGSIIWARYFKGVTKFKELNQRLVKDGKPLDSEKENIDELLRQAQDFAQKRLPVLRALKVV